MRLNRVWKSLTLLLINLIILAGLLFGFEFYLRLTDLFPNLPFDSTYYDRHRSLYDTLTVPGLEEYTWGHVVTNNTIGFREREFAISKPAGVCRVMVLGDSLTWGVGLAAEERYTTLAETYLNNHFSEWNFEVLNFGVSGAPTTVERDILQAYQDLVTPDLIVVGFVNNDTQPRSQGYTAEREMFTKQYGYLLDLLPQTLFQLRLPHTANLSRTALNNFIITVGLIPPWEVGVQRTYEPDSVEWLTFKQALQDIRAMSDEMSLPPPIFTVLNGGIFTEQPTTVDNMSESLPIYLRWYHQGEQTAAALGFTTYNHEPELLAQLTPAEIEVNALDRHPSAKVNVIYAQKLFETIAAYLQDDKLCRPTSPQMPQPIAAEPLATKKYMRVRFGEDIRFLGYVTDQPPRSPGQTGSIIFGWQALTDATRNYLIQTYWLGADGQRWNEQETLPCHGDCPTLYWPAGLLAAPGTSTIYWPSAVNLNLLPPETIFAQTHLAYRNGSQQTIALVPVPVSLIPFPGALIDEYPLALPPTIPAGVYALTLNMVDAVTGERLPAYDEVAERLVAEDSLILGTVVVP